MAKGDICRISNCKNFITYKGTVCGTHKWRWAKYRSYDLPDYDGEPSYYILRKPLPDGIVKICEFHGELTIENVYKRYYKGELSSVYCKTCILNLNIKKKYKGMSSLDEYDELLKKQNYLCEICKQKNNTTRNGKIKRYNIDHCHKTNNVRGLLCSFCNSMLGYSRDSIEILESAILYLKKHQQSDT